MTPAANTDIELDRAYVQSKVIKTGLEQLGQRLRDVEPGLQDEVAALSQRFDACVRRLGDASTRASGHHQALAVRP